MSLCGKPARAETGKVPGCWIGSRAVDTDHGPGQGSSRHGIFIGASHDLYFACEMKIMTHTNEDPVNGWSPDWLGVAWGRGAV